MLDVNGTLWSSKFVFPERVHSQKHTRLHRHTVNFVGFTIQQDPKSVQNTIL